jgi:hypothetical protein
MFFFFFFFFISSFNHTHSSTTTPRSVQTHAQAEIVEQTHGFTITPRSAQTHAQAKIGTNPRLHHQARIGKPKFTESNSSLIKTHQTHLKPINHCAPRRDRDRSPFPTTTKGNRGESREGNEEIEIGVMENFWESKTEGEKRRGKKKKNEERKKSAKMKKKKKLK